MSEKKKKVFISGPMSGIKDYNKPAFDKAEEYLTQAGYSVFNPARMHFDDAWNHSEIMRIDLAALAQCDYILMLDKWYNSKGAIHEYHYAHAIGVEFLSMNDIDNTKKEEKPKQRIEIETFGDISGENIDFLKWVEKHCNEILANGGKLIEDVEVHIDSTTHDILRMMTYLNNHSAFGLNPKIDPSKTCAGCKYHKYSVNEEPCNSCNPAFHTRWEPKPTSDAPKTCGTCKYNNGSQPLRPCSDCGPFKNWEPKDAEK